MYPRLLSFIRHLPTIALIQLPLVPLPPHCRIPPFIPTATPLTEEPQIQQHVFGLLFSVLIIAACVIGGMAVWLIRDPD